MTENGGLLSRSCTQKTGMMDTRTGEAEDGGGRGELINSSIEMHEVAAQDEGDAALSIKLPEVRANKLMTAKTASEDILSGIMLMHAVIRLLDLDTSTTEGRVILGLTIISMILQVVVIIVLLVTAFLDFDDPRYKRPVERLTKTSTTIIVVLAIIETVATGVQAYVAGKESTVNQVTNGSST